MQYCYMGQTLAAPVLFNFRKEASRGDSREHDHEDKNLIDNTSHRNVDSESHKGRTVEAKAHQDHVDRKQVVESSCRSKSTSSIWTQTSETPRFRNLFSHSDTFRRTERSDTDLDNATDILHVHRRDCPLVENMYKKEADDVSLMSWTNTGAKITVNDDKILDMKSLLSFDSELGEKTPLTEGLVSLERPPSRHSEPTERKESQVQEKKLPTYTLTEDSYPETQQELSTGSKSQGSPRQGWKRMKQLMASLYCAGSTYDNIDKTN